MIQNTSAVFNFRLETDGIGSLSYKPNCACFKGINKCTLKNKQALYKKLFQTT